VSLLATEASNLPVCLNLYITKSGKKTSAPPHTDKQDVLVVQTQGVKHWKVYAPPNSVLSPSADPFARGKNDDNLPKHKLEKMSALLLDVCMRPGDVLFIPARFPHTTDTSSNVDESQQTADADSIHLTIGFDNHVWDLNLWNIRRAAFVKGGLNDSLNAASALNSLDDVNLREELLSGVDCSFLADDSHSSQASANKVVTALMAIDKNLAFFPAPTREAYVETVEQFQHTGKKILQEHKVSE